MLEFSFKSLVGTYRIIIIRHLKRILTKKMLIMFRAKLIASICLRKITNLLTYY